VIASKTRMRQGRICVGAHDLDSFRSLRLFRHDGRYLEEDAQLEIGEVWELDYADRPGATAPHLEDVLVAAGSATRRGREQNLGRLVLERDQVWSYPAELFDGRLNVTAGGSAYVPTTGPLPNRSTGYWRLDHELTLYTVNDKPRYRWTGVGDLRSIRYVGVADPDPVIPAGSLVRLSLSHPFTPPDGPGGYWLQLSGWYRM
jgi:hypothetical protein